jgi:hypothetical protein
VSDETTIRRGARNTRYTTVPNHVFEDMRLSMEARWLLGYLLSKPDNWTVRMGDIRKKGSCGRDKARAMVSELVDAGYIEREDARKGGKFNGLSLVIYDEPQGERSPEPESVASLPQTYLPATVEPAPVNPPLVKTEDLAIPDSQPERAGARAREGTDREDRKRAEARGWRLLARWPGFAGMPKNRAMKAWMALDAAAQDRAERRFDAWLAQLKAQRKDHVPAPSTYFGEALFDEVADPVDAVPPVEAKPFGKAGMALRLARLVAGPTFTVLRLSAFEECMVADGKADRAALMAAKQAAQGYPLVTQMDEQRALTVAPEVAALGEGFVAARRGDDRFADWERLHARRGWPWVPPWVEWVWLPPGAAETAMAQFEAAMRGQGDDDAAGRTAAE